MKTIVHKLLLISELRKILDELEDFLVKGKRNLVVHRMIEKKINELSMNITEN